MPHPRARFTLPVLCVLCAALALAAAPRPAGAVVVELPGSEIRFEPPEDMCLLRPGRSWPEFELVQAARTLVERSGEAEAFAVTADCDELDALRAREIDRLAHYGIFSVFLVDGEVRPLPDTSREELIAYLSEQEAAAEDEEPDAVAEQMEAMIEDLTVEESRMLDGVPPDDVAAYQALVTTMVFDDRRTTVLGISGNTMIRTYPVAFWRYRPYEGEGTVADLLDRQRAFMQRLVAMNAPDAAFPADADRIGPARPTQRPPMPRREADGDLVTRLWPIVLVVGVVVAALAWRRRSVKGPGGRA
jgi:hypothetical protein